MFLNNRVSLAIQRLDWKISSTAKDIKFSHEHSSVDRRSPLVSSGVGGTLNADVMCIVAELVYETIYRLSGGFSETTTTLANLDLNSYVNQLTNAAEPVVDRRLHPTCLKIQYTHLRRSRCSTPTFRRYVHRIVQGFGEGFKVLCYR